MKSNGTVVASVLCAVLIAFFVYQWWFNPTREVQQRLNDIAVLLSIPDNEPPMARVTRTAQLRRFLADDARVRAGDAQLTSRDEIVAAVSVLTAPPGGWNVQFVDVQIHVNRDTRAAADVFLSIEVNGRDARTGQPTVDTRDAAVTMTKQTDEWVVATVEIAGGPQRPAPH